MRTYPNSKSKRTYAPRRRTGATVKKPYGGSRYGNDAFVKVEAIEPLANIGPNGEVFATMRVIANPGGVLLPGNTYLNNQREFIAFQPLYARYEIVGMKAEVTVAPTVRWNACNLAGGFAPLILSQALYPSEDQNVAYPL
ncbi:MAG: hypothetical protein [Circular genetic element sp.]|nr:MAG: hypothetical protein [Circular genetic element sp.]